MCVDCSVSRKKNQMEKSGTVGRARISGVYWILNVFKLHQFQWQQDFFFCCWSYRDESSNKQNEGCWTVIDVCSNFVVNCKKCRIWPGFLFIHTTEEVSLAIWLCRKVAVIISSVKAECVTPMSCVGAWCPLKQSQAVAYFRTKIIHLKIPVAVSCSHSICTNFKSEWQLQ